MGQDSVGGRIEISQEEKTARFEHPEDLYKPLALQIIRKMMDHRTADDQVESGIREDNLLDQSDVEDSPGTCSLYLFPSHLDHLRGRGQHETAPVGTLCDLVAMS